MYIKHSAENRIENHYGTETGRGNHLMRSFIICSLQNAAKDNQVNRIR
jgi:hypothetical protein